LARRSHADIRAELLHIWEVLQDCVRRGCGTEGVMPGGLKVRRRGAVPHYYLRFVPGARDDAVSAHRRAIGALYKESASISGAEVGCQGEVGSACSMAAGAPCEVLGGSPA
jgi:L-serine dehydratase